MLDLVLVSMHERGFPMADLYQGHGETDPHEFEAISPSPDGFFTMKHGDTIENAFEKAQQKWPEAVIIIAEDQDFDEENEE